MEELLKIAEELVTSLRDKIASCGKLMSSLQIREKKIEREEQENVDRDKNLSLREASIGPAEGFAEMKKQALKDKEEANAMLKATKQEKATHDRLILSEKEAIDKAKKSAAIDFQKAKDELVMIQKEWTGLKEEQKNWKAKFVEDMKKKLG